MPAAMKRPSSVPVDAAKEVKEVKEVKRRKSQSAEVKEVKVDKAILAALGKRKTGAESLPADVISMLSAMLPHAVGKESGRHSNQEKLLDFAFKELKVVESGLLAEVAEQQQVVDGADQERARRTAAEADAATALEPKKGAAAAAKERQDTTAAAATEAKAKLQEALDVAKAGDVAAAAAETKLEQLKLALETKDRLEHPEPPAAAVAQEPASPAPDSAAKSPGRKSPAKSPAGTPKSAAKSPGRKSPAKLRSEANALATQLQGLFDDESLLDATKVSLAKFPEDRGEFDQRVLQQLHVALTDALEAQSKASQALADGKASRQSNLDTLTAAKDQALEVAVDTEMAASDAKAASDEAESALKVAQKHVASFEDEIEKAREKVAKAEAKVADYRAGALAAFEALRNPPPPLPEVAEAANEEESAVAREPGAAEA